MYSGVVHTNVFEDHAASIFRSLHSNNPEDDNLNFHRHENLKIRKAHLVCKYKNFLQLHILRNCTQIQAHI